MPRAEFEFQIWDLNKQIAEAVCFAFYVYWIGACKEWEQRPSMGGGEQMWCSVNISVNCSGVCVCVCSGRWGVGALPFGFLCFKLLVTVVVSCLPESQLDFRTELRPLFSCCGSPFANTAL